MSTCGVDFSADRSSVDLLSSNGGGVAVGVASKGGGERGRGGEGGEGGGVG